MRKIRYSIPFAVALTTLALAASASATTLSDVNLGHPAGAGSATYDQALSAYTLNGQGSFSSADNGAFGNFDYVALSGDFDVSAQITSVSAATDAGILAINGLDSRNIYATAFLKAYAIPTTTAGYSYVTNYDGSNTQGTMTSGAGYRWVRLWRQGTAFHEDASLDGVNWDQLMGVSLNAGTTVDVGLFVNSQNGSTASASFSNLSGFGVSAPVAGSSSTSSVPEPPMFSLLSLALLVALALRRRSRVCS